MTLQSTEQAIKEIIKRLDNQTVLMVMGEIAQSEPGIERPRTALFGYAEKGFPFK